MTSGTGADDAGPGQLRREPPRFRRARVARTERRSGRMVRVTLAGPELEGLDPGLPGASVRLLLPSPGVDGPVLELPEWNGNEFLRADGTRPVIRTLTPLRVGTDPPELDVEVVVHGDGPLSRWAEHAEPGDEVAVSGTGRGYDVDPAAGSFLIVGDESALPAISTLLPALPAEADVTVLAGVQDASGRLELPDHPRAQVTWCEPAPGGTVGEALLDAVSGLDLPDDVRVWAAGEAAAVQALRKHLFEVRGLPRSHCVVRGYWKQGRAGPGT